MAGGILAGLSAVSGLIGAVGGVPAAAHEIGALVDRFVPDPNQKAAAALELQKLLSAEKIAAAQATADFAKGQATINLADAQSPSWFRANWRPALGWVAGLGLAYGLIGQPLLAWIIGILSVAIGANLPSPPPIDLDHVLLILGTLTGVGTMRTVEKIKGVA